MGKQAGDKNRRRGILFALVAANAPQARRQTGSAGARRPHAGEHEANLSQERPYFPLGDFFFFLPLFFMTGVLRKA